MSISWFRPTRVEKFNGIVHGDDRIAGAHVRVDQLRTRTSRALENGAVT